MNILKKYLALAICGLLLLVAAAWMIAFRSERPVEQPSSLAEVVAELEYSLKLLDYPFPDERLETASEKISLASAAWEKFIRFYGIVQPPEYGQTRDWAKKMAIIKKYASKANELALENRTEEAVAEIRKAFAVFRKIKEDNNIFSLADEILIFYQSARLVGKVGSKAEAEMKLDDLKLAFTALKERASAPKYEFLLAKLERAIMDIERLLPGPDFKKAQSDLLAGAEELYWQY
jgi:hypothetical protein